VGNGKAGTPYHHHLFITSPIAKEVQEKELKEWVAWPEKPGTLARKQIRKVQ
jgi:hypothetical protein